MSLSGIEGGDQKLRYRHTVPINVKDRDVFHLTIEEYLLALTNTIDELVRILPPFHLAVQVSSMVLQNR